MIVLSAGMPKSGSAWYFNLTNDLLVATGHQDVRVVRDRFRLQGILNYHNCNIGEHTPYKLVRILVPHFSGNTFAVKTHDHPSKALRALISAGIVKATYIYRDPRDVAVSAFEHGERIRSRGESHTFAQAKSMEEAILMTKGWLIVWDGWMRCKNVLYARYEDLLADPVKEVERLTDFLAVHVLPETIQRIVAAYQPEQLDVGRAAGINFNKGVSGRFREVMSQRELDLCREHFGDYLQRMGYPD